MHLSRADCTLRCPRTILGSTEPPTLTKLFQSTRNTLALQARGELHNTLHQSDSGNALLTNLCNIARCALDPPTGAKARTRTLALDCLRFGVELGDGGNEGFFSDVLEESAIGARDERWGVRAAAARLAGAVLRAGAGRSGSDDRRLLSLLSSRNVRGTFSGLESKRSPFCALLTRLIVRHYPYLLFPVFSLYFLRQRALCWCDGSCASCVCNITKHQ